MMKVLGIIPARYGSTRLPGKPLLEIGQKPMVRWVYERAEKAEALDRLVVATDDKRIREAVENFGGTAVLTDEEHQTGTERCAEAARKVEGDFEVVINVQGDEPLVHTGQINKLAGLFGQEGVQLGTLVKPIGQPEDLPDPAVMKVVLNRAKEALYFSRNPVPHVRDYPTEAWLSRHTFYKHIGLYGYRPDILQEIVQLAPTPLEQAEQLEQLRWLEHGYRVKVAETEHESISIDTPADLERFRARYEDNSG